MRKNGIVKDKEDPDFSSVSETEINNNDFCVAVVVDNTTGVQYVVVREAMNIGICPRYNADGTLFTGK